MLKKNMELAILFILLILIIGLINIFLFNYITFGLSIIFLIYLLFRIFFIYIFPYFKNKELIKRQKPLDAMNFLYNKLKKEQSIQKRSSLYKRIVHLYNYLSETDKKEMREKLSEKDRKKIKEIMDSIKVLKANNWNDLN